MAAIVERHGAEAARQAGCALVGGETAEHPGLLGPDEFDLAGAATGVVEADAIARPGAGPARRRRARPGLVRAALQRLLPGPPRSSAQAGLDAGQRRRPSSAAPSATELLEPTRIYALACLALAADCDVHAYAHITGGGLAANLARVLPGRRRRGAGPRDLDAAADLRRAGRGPARSRARRWSGRSTWGVGMAAVVARTHRRRPGPAGRARRARLGAGRGGARLRRSPPRRDVPAGAGMDTSTGRRALAPAAARCPGDHGGRWALVPGLSGSAATPACAQPERSALAIRQIKPRCGTADYSGSRPFVVFLVLFLGVVLIAIRGNRVICRVVVVRAYAQLRTQRSRSVPPLLYLSWRATFTCLALARPRPIGSTPSKVRSPDGPLHVCIAGFPHNKRTRRALRARTRRAPASVQV